MKWWKDSILWLIVIAGILWFLEGYFLLDARFRLIATEERIQKLQNKVQELQERVK